MSGRTGACIRRVHDYKVQSYGIKDENCSGAAVPEDRSREHQNTSLNGVQALICPRSFLQNHGVNKPSAKLLETGVVAAYPPTECFERVHRLFVSRVIFTHIIGATGRGRWQGVKLRSRRSRPSLFSIALHVSHFFIQLKIVCLQIFHLCPEIRNDLELFAQLL